MRGLIPLEIEIVLAGFGCIEPIILIAIADVLTADVNLIEAVPASRGHPAVPEWSRLDGAVLVVFSETVLPQVVQSVPLRIVDKEEAAHIPFDVGTTRGQRGS